MSPLEKSKNMVTVRVSGQWAYGTFLAVVPVVVQHEAAAALTAVAPKSVYAFVLAAAVTFGALVYIC